VLRERRREVVPVEVLAETVVSFDDPVLAMLGWRVPRGRLIELPGRGTTFARELAGPSPEAPTLVLLHGLAANSGLNWFAAMAPLAEHFRVVAIDHRGHGRGMHSQSRFRLCDCADDVVALADVLGIDRFVPVGYSMGGPIAQLIWHRHRERVEAMVLCATARNFRGTVRERVEFAGLGLALAGAMTWRGQGAGWVRNIVEGFAVPDLANPLMRRWVLDELRLNDTRALLEAAEALGRFSSHSWVGHIDVPVAVVVPTSDSLVPVRRQVKLAKAIPGAVLFPVEGDHLAAALAPDRFVPSLVDAALVVAHRARRSGPPLTSLR
jgi:3-oxoadipate enol-lactonase